MPRILHHVNPDCCEPLISYVLESNDIIVDRNKLIEVFKAAGLFMPDRFINELSTQPNLPKKEF